MDNNGRNTHVHWSGYGFGIGPYCLRLTLIETVTECGQAVWLLSHGVGIVLFLCFVLLSAIVEGIVGVTLFKFYCSLLCLALFFEC